MTARIAEASTRSIRRAVQVTADLTVSHDVTIHSGIQDRAIVVGDFF